MLSWVCNLTYLSLSFLICKMGVRRTSQLPSSGDKAQIGKHSIKHEAPHTPREEHTAPNLLRLSGAEEQEVSNVHQAGLVGSEGVEGCVYGVPRQPVQGSRMANWHISSTVVTAS